MKLNNNCHTEDGAGRKNSLIPGKMSSVAAFMKAMEAVIMLLRSILKNQIESER